MLSHSWLISRLVCMSRENIQALEIFLMDKLFQSEHFLSREQTTEQNKTNKQTRTPTLENYLSSWDIILYQACLQNKVKHFQRIWLNAFQDPIPYLERGHDTAISQTGKEHPA